MCQDGLDDWTGGDGKFNLEETDDGPADDVSSKIFARVTEAVREEVGANMDFSGVVETLPEDAAQYEHSHSQFQQKLIAHFNYRWHLGSDHPDCVRWPRSNGVAYSHHIVHNRHLQPE